MTTSNCDYRSFPPIEDLVDLVRSVDSQRALHNLKRAGRVATNCLIWAVALTVVGVRLFRQAAPHMAKLLRALADNIDPDSAPIFEPMTVNTIQFFEKQAQQRDLESLSKVELMKLANTKSRRFTKKQLITQIEAAATK